MSINSSLEEDQSTQESIEDIAMGGIHLPGEERFYTGLLSTRKGARLIEPRINDDMNDNSDNEEIDTSYESATFEIKLGDDDSDKSGDRIEKSDKENGVILNRNTTAIEQLHKKPTKKKSKAKG